MASDTDPQKVEARALRARGLSYRQIAELVGVSHVTVMLWVRDVSPPGRGAGRGMLAHLQPQGRLAPARLAPHDPESPTPDPRTASLLEVCTALLALLRHRAHEASHPQIRNRFAADASALAAQVVRLERAQSRRADRLEMSATEALAAMRTIQSQFNSWMAKQDLRCARCGIELICAPLPDPNETEPVLVALAAQESTATADEKLTEARDLLALVLEDANSADAVGDEVSTQRSGRAAITIASAIARLERALDSAGPEPLEFDESEANMCSENFDALRAFAHDAGGLCCADCIALTNIDRAQAHDLNNPGTTK